MSEAFVEMLRGDSNTLGRTDEVAQIVLNDPSRAAEVFELFFQDDEWVRLRAASVSKRLWRGDGEIFKPFVAGWVAKVSLINQASSQWTFAQFCQECDHLLTEKQRTTSIKRVLDYIENEDDWMVLNSSISALTAWAEQRPALAAVVRPHLKRLSQDQRKSVAKRATRSLNLLQ